MYFQLDDRQEALEARQAQGTQGTSDPRVSFMEYVKAEAITLPPVAFEYFREEIFKVLTKAREKAAQEKAAQVV